MRSRLSRRQTSGPGTTGGASAGATTRTTGNGYVGFRTPVCAFPDAASFAACKRGGDECTGLPALGRRGFDLLVAVALVAAARHRRERLATLPAESARLRHYALFLFAAGPVVWLVAGVFLWLDAGSRADEAHLGWPAYTIWLVAPICLLGGAAWVFPRRGSLVVGVLMLAGGLLNLISGLANLVAREIPENVTAGDLALGVGVIVVLVVGGALFVLVVGGALFVWSALSSGPAARRPPRWLHRPFAGAPLNDDPRLAGTICDMNRALLATAAATLAAALALMAARAAATAAVGKSAAGPYRNGLIAFVRCCGPETGIYVIRPDGSGEKRLFEPVGDDAPLDPVWSPGGKQIAFVPGAPRGGVWVMHASGAKQRRITVGKGDSLFPGWAPSGKWIVFTDLGSSRSGFHDLYLVRTNGSGLKQLTKASVDEISPAWAPNGGEIVYARGRDLWRMKPDGSGQRLLARKASAPSWSPGGTHIAFIRGSDPWVVARDGTGAKRVADMQIHQAAVAWSPDGRWLVTAPFDRGDLMLVRADGSQTRPLTKERGYGHAWPSWQRLPA